MTIHFSKYPEVAELQKKVLALGNFFAQDPDKLNETYVEAQQIFTQVEPQHTAQE